jgi:cytochrome c oxidase subunit II
MAAIATGNPTLLALLAAVGGIPFSPLFTTLMVLAAAVVGLVTALLIVIVTRSRGGLDTPIPPQEHGNRRLEIAWTVAPAVVVAALLGVTVVAMANGPTPGSGLPRERGDPDIIVVGHQWWWEVRYPKQGVVTANDVYLPAGQLLLVQLESVDVQHAFWVPQLGQKMDMYPGKVNHLWLDTREKAPGEYQGVCAEFCGTQHAGMRVLAVVVPQAEFDAWVEAQRGSTQPPPAFGERGPDPTALGSQLFSQYACGSCHAIAGTEYNAQAAPALTNYSARRTISAGVLPHTRENLARYLHDPHEVKPGVLMPNFRLKDWEVEALVAYLESLR